MEHYDVTKEDVGRIFTIKSVINPGKLTRVLIRSWDQEQGIEAELLDDYSEPWRAGATYPLLNPIAIQGWHEEGDKKKVPILYDTNNEPLYVGDRVKYYGGEDKDWDKQLKQNIVLEVLDTLEKGYTVTLVVVEGKEFIKHELWTNSENGEYYWTASPDERLMIFEKIVKKSVYTIKPDGTWGHMECELN